MYSIFCQNPVVCDTDTIQNIEEAKVKSAKGEKTIRIHSEVSLVKVKKNEQDDLVKISD